MPEMSHPQEWGRPIQSQVTTPLPAGNKTGGGDHKSRERRSEQKSRDSGNVSLNIDTGDGRVDAPDIQFVPSLKTQGPATALAGVQF
jgi:hypothetical protein